MKINLNNSAENEFSLYRPAWTQSDLTAFRHLHRYGKIEERYFEKTKGLVSQKDLHYFESGNYGE